MTARMLAGLGAALEEVRARHMARNPLSRQRFADASLVMPGGNTRTSLYYTPFPITFRSGEAQHLEDLDGHRYLDFLGEYSAGLYGHSHPVIMAAVREALDAGLALGGPNQYDVELAQQIVARFPSVELLRFTNSGTEATLMAISTARAVTQRPGVMVFEGGYHGSVLAFRTPSALNVPFPYITGSYNDLEHTVHQLRTNATDLAAVIVEPMLGGGGAIPATGQFLRILRDATSELHIPLIFDEVMTSRLAPGGAQQLYGIRPDMTTFGKYIGAGFSVGAFGGARALMERYDPTIAGSLSHPGTFNNNTVSMAAGAAGLREVFTPEAATALNTRGDALRTRLNDLFAARDVAMLATGLGSILNIHFQREPIARPADVVPCEPHRELLHLGMMERGIYFARRGYITVSLALDDRDIDSFVDATADFLDHYGSELR